MTTTSTARCGVAGDLGCYDVGLELARTITAASSLAEAWQRLTAAALALVPAAESAGITTLATHPLATHQLSTASATSELPARLDALHLECGGPCLDALLGPAGQVRVDDLASETRWPQFAAAANDHTPVRSMLSSRVYLDADNPIAALTLYSPVACAFDDDVARTAALLVAQTAPAVAFVAERDKTAHLQQALQTSRTIGTAIGVLMARLLITADEGFDLLRLASQDSHRKLRDLAVDVVETGTLDVVMSSTSGSTAAGRRAS